MDKRHYISDTTEGINWLSQFDLCDKELASTIADSIVIVSNSDFEETITRLIHQNTPPNQKAALYFEREVETTRNTTSLLTTPIQSKNNKRFLNVNPQEKQNGTLSIGSESIVSKILSDIQKKSPSTYFLEPPPNIYIKKKIENIIIATDLIGSGDRIYSILSKFWESPTIKSWYSYKKINFIIVAHTANSSSVDYIKNHKTNPEVYYENELRTVENYFSKPECEALKKLCNDYAHDNEPDFFRNSLGFRNCGALIAFNHGIPNNTPEIFHRYIKKKWNPLFERRISNNIIRNIKESNNKDLLIKRLKKNNKDLNSVLLEKLTNDHSKIFLILSSLTKKGQSTKRISIETNLNFSTIHHTLKILENYCWITKSLRLTDDGRRTLKILKKRLSISSSKEVTFFSPMGYYPTSLRGQDEV